MNRDARKVNRKTISLIIMMAISPLLYAESASIQTSMDTMDATATMDTTATNSQDVDMLAGSFDDFLGEQASTLIEGLRNGEEFTLTSSYTDASGTQQIETITIEPPTSKMGFGNVKLTLKMAENLLSQSGISQPTAIQLETALLGGSLTAPDGTVTDVEGVLTLRSEGMGWGQIARQYGSQAGSLPGNSSTKVNGNSSNNAGITTAAADNAASPANGK